MPRTLPGSLGTAITAPVTAPGYLVQLGFPIPLRYSTIATSTPTTWDSRLWTAGGVEVLSVSATDARISLRNHDNSISALVLGNQLHRVTCAVWQIYGSDAVALFDGWVDEATLGPRVVLTAIAQSRAVQVPSDFIAPPTFNHLTPPGTPISWGTNTIYLEADGG